MAINRNSTICCCKTDHSELGCLTNVRVNFFASHCLYVLLVTVCILWVFCECLNCPVLTWNQRILICSKSFLLSFLLTTDWKKCIASYFPSCWGFATDRFITNPKFYYMFIGINALNVQMGIFQSNLDPKTSEQWNNA